MENTTINGLKSLFQILPNTLKKFIVSESWVTRVENTAARYSLTEEQTEGLRQETLFVLLGIEDVANYRANLVEELDITYDQALKISYDMNAQVFGQVMNELKAIREGAATQNRSQPTPKPPTSKPTPRPEPRNPFIPNPNKAGVVKNVPETDPVHILMDHNEMERVDGVHLHSQNVMPTPSGNIIDQKLSRIFKSPTQSAAPSNLPTGNPKPQSQQSKGYGNKDPYREPLE